MLKSPFRAGIAAAFFILLVPATSHATIVEFQTSLGNFEVNLYDNGTPDTVANFMDYVNNGDYTDVVIHRSVPGFIIQGGGFAYDPANQLVNVFADPAVGNEPEFSNVRGTISMAKLGGLPDSATNQWFFNLGDNSVDLDPQNGGFTVFGEVVGNGMDVVDAIAALPRFAFDSPFGELPLRNYTATDFTNGVVPDDNHFMIITAVVISDSNVDSAAGLSPTPNALIDSVNNPGNGGGGNAGGGGAISFLLLLAILVGGRRVLSRR